jgi:RNA recognition motif-containing protein
MHSHFSCWIWDILQAMNSTQPAPTTTDAAPVDASASVTVESTSTLPLDSTLSQAMEVDISEDSRKRKVDDVAHVEDNNAPKRQRLEKDKDAAPARDREYASVLVSGMSSGVTEADVRKFFRECGQIRDVALTQQNEGMLASVEFMNRDSVPAALTRDKKRIGEDEVHVYQAGHTTLFVTNFPESMDDASLRELFTPFGDIVETRWPSKKFKDSRRFCYIQFSTTGAAAAAAEELNGKELETGFPISVLISDPDRKKQRSGANADARELYVSQLSKFMNEQDMDRVFSPVSPISANEMEPY